MCRYNVIWPSQGFTCVNVCSLNCLNLFLKYKIGLTCLVCVCVYVFGIIVLKTFVERWFWELKMLIFGWVVWLIAFIFVFFPFWKMVFKQSRHLAICQALKVFSYHNLDRSSTVGGSNVKVPGPSIASQLLVDRSSFSSCVFSLFVNTFSTVVSVDVVFLDTFLDRWLDTSRHLYLSRITEDLYICSSRFGSHFFDFSQSVHSYSSPKHYLSYSKPLP